MLSKSAKRLVRITWEQMRFKLDVWCKLLLFAAPFAAILPLCSGLVHAAQDQTMTGGSGIEGSWQGTLPGPNGDQRMVLKIRKDDSGALKVILFPLNMNGPMGTPRFAATDVSYADNELRFSLAFMGSSFAGKMSSDHNSIRGAWTGQQGTQRLLLVRATPDTAWAIPQAPPPMKPMAADANPGIEVATIKPSKPSGMTIKGIRINGDRLIMSDVSLKDMLAFAYNLEPKQIVNAPSWFNSDAYDIEVQPDQPGAPSKDQWTGILQKLLADRFQLKQHTEQRVLPAYILTVAKGGPKMIAVQKTEGRGEPEETRLRAGTIDARALSMADFAETLRKIFDRPVVDQTGLAGFWTFSLKWTPDESQAGLTKRDPRPPSEEPADAPPPLFTALHEQLGLKLSSAKT